MSFRAARGREIESVGLGKSRDFSLKRPSEPWQHGLDVGRLNRCTAPDPQTSGGIPVSTDIKCDPFDLKPFGHGLGKYATIRDPISGEF